MTTKVPPATGKPRPAVKAATKDVGLKAVSDAQTPEPAKTEAPETSTAEISKPETSKPEAPEISKKELLERVVDESGMKRSDVRQVLDATLRVLGTAIGEGATIAAAPLGKIKVTRSKETPNGKLAVCRVKLK